ncbi:hypothetical protein N7478_010122 [Penicillium angulare]|uniref:uncharacterized protein n=1 Tax=Penicillium angulare TaxID=116970 RepID=UPI002541D6A0|nr:uncharacterized protein N7478_010122 [Penicillium angulare]KAJ5267314.1 hypothetical protein N7478_010122 [Penicillium angulare]
MPSNSRILPTATERLSGLWKRIFEFALLIALISTILLRPTHSGKLNFHPSKAPTLYSMSLITTVLSCTVSLMMEFYRDDSLIPDRLERILMWVPLVLLDLSIVELIAGISASSVSAEHRGILSWYSRGIVLGCICLAIFLAYRRICRANYAVRAGGLE